MKRKIDFLNFYFPMLFIVLLAIVLRVIGVKWGLPMAFHNDEPVLVLASQQFFSGDFNPHNFLYPSLLMYIMHFVQRIFYLVSSNPIDLVTLYILSRLTVGAFGVACVIMAVILGRKHFNKTVGLAAGLIVAISHLHVVHSHFATTDVPLTFFILLTLYWTINLAENGGLKNYILTGICFGLTVSIKIPGAVLFVPILIAHLYQNKICYQVDYKKIFSKYFSNKVFLLTNFLISLLFGIIVFLIFKNFDIVASKILSVIKIDLWIKYYDDIVLNVGLSALKFGIMIFLGLLVVLTSGPVVFFKIRNLLILVGIAIVTFFSTTPYAILDFKTFVRDFLFQMVISQTNWSGQFADNSPAFITNYMYLQNDFGLIFILLAVIGIASVLIKHKVSGLAIVGTAFVYYAYLGTWKIMFDRYMVPMVPFIALFSMVGLVFIGNKVTGFFPKDQNKYKMIVVSLLVLFMAWPSWKLLGKSVGFDKYLLKKNTKTIAYEWGLEYIPKTAKVLREQYAPELEIDGYDVLNVNFAFNDSVNINYVQKHNIEYIVVTDKLWARKIQEDGILKKREAYDNIIDYADLIYHIKPSSTHPGPEIKIFKVNE